MKQTEITEKTKLLDSSGAVATPGWARADHYVYNRENIRANPARIKEWDFYQFEDRRYTIQITFADISIAGGAVFCIFDRETGEKLQVLSPSLLTFGRMGLPADDSVPHTLKKSSPGFRIELNASNKARVFMLDAASPKGKIHAELRADIPQPNEFLEMAVPFDDPTRFYLNKKMNCMPASGFVKIGGHMIALDTETAFCVLDHGRGVWPYHEQWWWGNGSTRLPDGRLFGFEIGWGFGKMEAFTENTLFIAGRAHKIGDLHLDVDTSDYMKPWAFTSDDGRFNLTMTPKYDNRGGRIIPGLLGSITHQVHGLWNGFVIADDGEKIAIRDMIAFCEHCDNKW